MNPEYYQGTTKLEGMGVEDDYLVGWQCGFLGHPDREEQRITDAYTAGYADGQKKSFEKASEFKKS